MPDQRPPVSKEDLDHILNHTRHLWEELRDQQIFITGGTGFFGCWLLESFIWANDKLELNAKAYVLSRDPETFKSKAPHIFNHPAIHFHIGDITNFTFPNTKFRYLIHAATTPSISLNNESPLLMLETITQGTKHTLNFAKQCCAKKVLLTSSGSIYGKQPPTLKHIPEDYYGAPDSCSLQSAYAEGKRMAELQAVLYADKHKFEVKIARCFSFIGPHLPVDGRFAVGNFLRDALTTKKIKILGDGSPYRSYLYAADLAIWLWTILFLGNNSTPYNVGSDHELTIAELAETIASQCSPKPAVSIAQSTNQAKKPERYIPDIQKAVCSLDLKVWTSLEDAIKKSIDWYTQLFFHQN